MAVQARKIMECFRIGIAINRSAPETEQKNRERGFSGFQAAG